MPAVPALDSRAGKSMARNTYKRSAVVRATGKAGETVIHNIDFTLEIDWEALDKRLAAKVNRSKHGKCIDLGGIIRAKIR